MKYSDEQRIKKIYENAVKLQKYIVENNIKRGRITHKHSAAVACYNSFIQYWRTCL